MLLQPSRIRSACPASAALAAALLTVIGKSTFAADPEDAYPFSQALQVLERDLTSPDYRDVLATMIHTDLAAEWQRVATPDNYQAFAEQHGGPAELAGDAGLQAAYQRRREIAERFLELMRGAYRGKNIRPPFDDAAQLAAVLASAGKRAEAHEAPTVRVRSLMPAPDAEQHWPCFRGPTGQGIVVDTDIPLLWSASQNVLWQTKLPGRGNSSPIIWGERLFVTAEGRPRDAAAPLAAGDEAPDRLLLCYSLAGELLWQQAAPQPAEHEVLYWKNTLASSTPVTDGERVISFFGNAGLLCCSVAGERLWHADLGTFPTMHGPGSTPALYRNLVVVIQDQDRGDSLCAAFDKRTGRRVWQQPRPNSMGWSSPLLLRVGDRDEVVFNGSHEVVSYHPQTGDVLWRAAGTSIESIPTIATGGGLLYSASGRNGPIFALRPGGEGNVADSHLVWRLERGGPHVPTPAYLDGRLYVIGDTGILTVLDAATGDTLSQQRLRGRFSTSPLIVADKLLLINEDGLTYVVASGDRPQVLAENDLEEPVLATPAVLGGRLYFRTGTRLICIGRMIFP